MPNIKTRVEEIPTPKDDKVADAFCNFMENVHLFTPEDRRKLVALFELMMMPKFLIKKVAPIEEEWVKGGDKNG